MQIKNVFLGLSLIVMGAFASPISVNGQLSVSGFNIVNQSGNPFILRGMSLFWDNWGFESFFNTNVINTLASSSWGSNVVRVPIHNLDESRAKSMIDAANNAGIYVIVDYHSHCAHRNASGAKTFFGNISSYVKQKGYKHVLYELYNEPLYENCSGPTDTQSGGSLTSWASIKSYAEGVISSIRANDPNGIIIVGTPNFSQGTEAARQSPINGKNIMYALHYYASTSGHASLRTNLLRAKCNNFPIFISEWGTSESSGDGNFSLDMNQAWMNWIESIGVSWANWSINDKGETSSALNGGAGSGGNWSDGQISASGKYVRNLIKGLNSGGSLASVGLSQTNVSCSLLDGPTEYEFVRTGAGLFGFVVQGENYLDSVNAKTVEYKNAQNGMYMAPQNTGATSTLSFSLGDVPARGSYYMYARLAANSNGTLTYSVNNGETENSVEYTSTGSSTTFAGFLGRIDLPKQGENNLKFSWQGDVNFDYFIIGYADSADSVNLNITDEPFQSLELPSHILKSFSFDSRSRLFNIPNGSFEELAIYTMKGNVVKKINVKGLSTVLLDKSMPNGLYMAVLKKQNYTIPIRIKLLQ